MFQIYRHKEKIVEISNLSIKIAQFNRKISGINSPSKRELFEKLLDNSLEKTFVLLGAYLRELSTLEGLASSTLLKEKLATYILEVPETAEAIPNRVQIAELIAEHVFILEKKRPLSETTIIRDSIVATRPDALIKYKGHFGAYCPPCESS